VRQPESVCDPRCRRDGVTATDYAVDATGLDKPLERRLVVDRHDRPPVGEAEPGRARIRIDRDHEQAPRAGGGKEPCPPRADDQQPHPDPVFAEHGTARHNGYMATILGERVEELRADRTHGGSWMARRAVEALAEVAAQPAASSEALLEELLTAGRQLARSRPGVGAVAGAVGRVLAAASRNGQLDVEQLRQLVQEEATALIDGRRRAAASIAIQLRERIEDAVVLTHSASATVREALLQASPSRVICTVSSPQGEGRDFSEDLRSSGLEVELVEDAQAPRSLEWASLLLVGADTLFRCGTLHNKTGTRALAEAAADESVPAIVACEVIKLAPIEAHDDPAVSTAEDFELTPPELIQCIVTEEGTFLPEEIRALVDRTPFLREGYTLLRSA
jgi:translation initiation factor 2B subunit (eIF-2B alpha/beta/delta family)